MSDDGWVDLGPTNLGPKEAQEMVDAVNSALGSYDRIERLDEYREAIDAIHCICDDPRTDPRPDCPAHRFRALNRDRVVGKVTEPKSAHRVANGRARSDEARRVDRAWRISLVALALAFANCVFQIWYALAT